MLGTEKGYGIVGQNEAKIYSNGIALDVGIREGWRVGLIEGALDVNELDNGLGRGPKVGPRNRCQWHSLCI